MRNNPALIHGLLLALCAAWPASGPVQAQAPLSAIDWLSDSVATEPEKTALPLLPPEAPVSDGAAVERIVVTPLDAVSADAVGLLPTATTGLPRDLWGPSRSSDLAEALSALDTDLLPALQDLVMTLLMAELDPPMDSDSTARLFLARIDALLARGAVDQAQALLDRAGPDSAELFRRWFDASLLNGTEQQSCERLAGTPGLSPTLTTRIFCLARLGDWNAAALTLDTGRALGELSKDEVTLLDRFLDAEGFEGEAALPLPDRPSPLTFRLYEAIGEPLPTASLPLAFAHHDLSPNAGWKAQVIAAERLARNGVVPPNLLLGLYAERRPAASGGVWARVAALQAFDAALQSGDPARVEGTLPRVWREMMGRGLEVVFARLYGKPLNALDLDGASAKLAFRIGLLSSQGEAIAAAHDPADADERFLIAVARGDIGDTPATGEVARAVRDGFTAPNPPSDLAEMVAGGELGAAILRAVALADEGVDGDLHKLSGALALFRAVGLEQVARQTALQALILDLHG